VREDTGCQGGGGVSICDQFVTPERRLQPRATKRRQAHRRAIRVILFARAALIGPLFALRVPFRYIDPGIDNGRRTPRGARSINAGRYEVTKKNEGRFNSTPAAPDAKRRLEIAPRAENSSLRRPASPRKTAERATDAAFCPSGSIYRVTRRLYRPTESNELGRRRANTSAAYCAAREPLALECVAR